MQRRDFLKVGVQAAVVGASVSAPACPGLAAARPAASALLPVTPAVLKSYTAADHRRRLQNIGACQREIRACMRRHLVTSYLPAQYCYNLGEYPCRKPWDPGEYDYLWVGEGVGKAEGLREAVKNHQPYVVPCIDMTFAKIENEDQPYLDGIPYMQFPVLQAGRPFTGERAMIPGVHYVSQDDFWMRRCRAAWKHYQASPHGPYTYGGWDAVPGRAETRPRHAHWLKQYFPLVEEGTWAWLEIGQSSLFARPLPKDVVASAFANRELYLVLANYGQTPAELETAADYLATDQPSAAPARRWNLPPRSLRILRRSSQGR